MGRGNSKAEFLGFGRRRQAAVTDCNISLPEVRSTEIIRPRELAALVYAARLSRTRTRLYMLEFPLGDAILDSPADFAAKRLRTIGVSTVPSVPLA